jgi:hypothetical protein
LSFRRIQFGHEQKSIEKAIEAHQIRKTGYQKDERLGHIPELAFSKREQTETKKGEGMSVMKSRKQIEGKVATMERVGMGSQDFRREHEIGWNAIESSRATLRAQRNGT